jgi:hypothetical protein
MTEIKVQRNPDGSLTQNCKENIGVMIGSYDCTDNCPHNQNTKNEIHEQAFYLEVVRCSKIKNQLTIEI